MIRKPPALEKYVRSVKKAFVIFSCFALPAMMVCAVFAFLGYVGFWFVLPAVIVVYLVVYGYYAMYVSMGTVIALEVTDQVVHLTTKRKIFTYDVQGGCIGVKAKNGKYVATFRTHDSQDSFIFYTHVPFSRHYEAAFDKEDLRAFYPLIDEVHKEV